MPREGPQPRRVRIVRYVDAAGNRVKKGTPGAKRVTTQSETFYAKIRGQRVSLHATDLRAAWVELNRLLEEGADCTQTHRNTALEEHITAYADHLKAKGTTENHRLQVAHDVRWCAKVANWSRLADLSAEGLEKALAKLDAAGRAAQTRKTYRAHCSAFAEWAVSRGRLRANPFASVPIPNVAADRRFVHREPTPEELGKLFAYLSGPRAVKRRKLEPWERATGYRVCLGTGFRADELRELDRSHFDLDRSTVTLPARADKRRKTTVQPLPSWLVDTLREYFARGGGMWNRFPSHDPGQVLSEDLTAACVPLAIEGPDCPQKFTFHSFRVSYISQLCQDPANDLKTVMELARHSDPKLTLKLYAKYRPAAGRAAMDRLPRPGESR